MHRHTVIHTHRGTHTQLYTQRYTHRHTHRGTHTEARTHSYTHPQAHTQTHTNTSTRTHTHTNICTLTPTHPHTKSPSLNCVSPVSANTSARPQSQPQSVAHPQRLINTEAFSSPPSSPAHLPGTVFSPSAVPPWHPLNVLSVGRERGA